jgi:hypothetical protein
MSAATLRRVSPRLDLYVPRTHAHYHALRRRLALAAEAGASGEYADARAYVQSILQRAEPRLAEGTLELLAAVARRGFLHGQASRPVGGPL